MTLCEKIDQYKQKLRNRRDKIVEILKNLDWEDALVKYNGESNDTPEYEVTFGSDELNEIISNGTIENFDVFRLTSDDIALQKIQGWWVKFDDDIIKCPQLTLFLQTAEALKYFR